MCVGGGVCVAGAARGLWGCFAGGASAWGLGFSPAGGRCPVPEGWGSVGRLLRFGARSLCPLAADWTAGLGFVCQIGGLLRVLALQWDLHVSVDLEFARGGRGWGGNPLMSGTRCRYYLEVFGCLVRVSCTPLTDGLHSVL